MRLEIQINEELLARVDRKCEKGARSAWISEAIKEKLSRSKNEDSDLKMMIEQIRKMDPLAMHGSLSDLVYTAQVIYKKLVEQEYTLKEIKEQISQEYEEDYEEEQEEIKAVNHKSNELSQYEKDQAMIDDYFKSVEQKYKK